MNPIEFSTQIEKLKETFGEKSYGKERSAIIFDRVKGLSASDWQEIVKNLICNQASTPTPQKIFEAAKPYLDKVSARALGNCNCSMCNGTGLVPVVHAKTLTEYVFKCTNCQSASVLGLSLDIPYWRGQKGFRTGTGPTKEEIREFREVNNVCQINKKQNFGDLKSIDDYLRLATV